MTAAAITYKKLLVDLLHRRLVGGKLDHFIGELDRCWHEMSDAEQAEIERTPERIQKLEAVAEAARDQAGHFAGPKLREALIALYGKENWK